MNNKRRGTNNDFLKETEALHNLRALEEIEKNPKISQRELSGQLGVALGITNALLKALARKGLIKIRGENNRSLSYHLTHSGVLAKSALAVKWTLNTVDFYRHARREVAGKLGSLVSKGIGSAIIYGSGELVEIALIVAPEAGLEVIGVIDSEPAGGRQLLGSSYINLESIGDVRADAVIVCDDGSDSIKKISKHVGANTDVINLFPRS